MSGHFVVSFVLLRSAYDRSPSFLDQFERVWISDMGRSDIRGVDLAMLRTFDALLRERSMSRAASVSSSVSPR
jgi:hypothetical protein